MATPTRRTPAPGRNDPCPCGSGKKYKNCHETRAGRMSTGRKALLLVLVAAFAVALVLAITSALGRSDQPGRVWSAEHGHWH